MQVYRSHDVEGTGQRFPCDLDPKVKGHIICLLVNASSPKLVNVATSNYAGV